MNQFITQLPAGLRAQSFHSVAFNTCQAALLIIRLNGAAESIELVNSTIRIQSGNAWYQATVVFLRKIIEWQTSLKSTG